MNTDAPVEKLRNLGPASAHWLQEIGVHTKADLERMGPVLIYRLVKERQPKASLNLLWALQGALADTDWRELSDATKERLRQQVEE
jgi:DNA transformation protein